MKPAILLRVASATSLLYCAGHTSGMPWMPPDGPETAALAQTMRAYRFDVMGSVRTLWDFHLGFGLIISLDLFVQAVLLWHLGTMANENAARVRPIIALLGLAVVANAILVGRYFFVAPLVMAIVIAGCLLGAFLLSAAPR